MKLDDTGLLPRNVEGALASGLCSRDVSRFTLCHWTPSGDVDYWAELAADRIPMIDSEIQTLSARLSRKIQLLPLVIIRLITGWCVFGAIAWMYSLLHDVGVDEIWF